MGGAATCSEGLVIWFLKVPHPCLGSMAARELSENSLQNLRNKWPPHPVVIREDQFKADSNIILEDIHIRGEPNSIKQEL